MRFGTAIPAVLSLLLLAAGPAKTPKKFWHTYPQPAKSRPADPMRLFPGIEVPEYPERFTWKVTAPKNDPKLTQAPVYNKGGNRLRKVGNVPVGTSVTLSEFLLVGKALFYGLKFTPEGGVEQIAWVNGTYIAPAGLASVQ